MRGVPEAGDLILTREAPVGQAGMIQHGVRVCLRQRTVLLRPDPEAVDGQFLLYLLVSPRVQERMHARGAGSTVAHLNIKEVRALELGLLPGVSVQRAIADVLGALDDKIALNERICSAVLEIGDAYYQAMADLGARVEYATLGQLMAEGALEFGDGYRTKKAEHGTPGLPILRVAEVGAGEITPSFGDHVRDEFRTAMGRKTSRSGDIVLTTKGTVGRVAMISPHDAEFVYSPQVCFFRAQAGASMSRIYLFHWLRGQEFWRQAVGMKGQTDMADYLSLGDIRSLKISLPGRSALADFDRQCAPLHARAEAARLENRTLADLRDTLLPQLVTGKLRVKDATRVVEEAV
ncbi:restriction endonuclease subunit S [Streptomyces sp. R-74717]|uniref:restriction endonuclease subunit S n=1 Tax=Streptomyces sp. R-74717 TaxID=2969820 RepID=UPI0039B61EF8